MKIDIEFSKYAHAYEKYAIIQTRVTKELLSLLRYKPKRILDLGCGRGAVLKNIDWDVEYFVGVDFAKRMLELHPQGEHIECIYANFEDPKLYERLLTKRFDYVISSSALQWAHDLDTLFAKIATLNAPIAFGIFTANTFKTVHETASLSPVLRDAKSVLQCARKHFECKHHLHTYRLEFKDNLEMFRYIKRSGVSGNRAVLSYKETKELIRRYPLNYLEFEVLFLYS